MKYISEPEYGSHVFESAEECLKYEGACEARKNRGGGDGCLFALLGVFALLMLLFGCP